MRLVAYGNLTTLWQQVGLGERGNFHSLYINPVDPQASVARGAAAALLREVTSRVVFGPPCRKGRRSFGAGRTGCRGRLALQAMQGVRLEDL